MDATKIADKAGNVLLQPRIQAYLKDFQFLDPTTKGNIDSGGNGLQSVVVLVFIAQVLLKLTLRSTMQYLWDLVHQMQFLNFLILMQVKFPLNLSSFIGFFEVASGKLDRIESFLPTIPKFIIDPDELNADPLLLQENFIDQDIFSILHCFCV